MVLFTRVYDKDMEKHKCFKIMVPEQLGIRMQQNDIGPASLQVIPCQAYQCIKGTKERS